MRITGQLIDATTGAHLWADRFDGALDDIFDLQDEMTASVVGAIEPKLEQAEIERARRKPTAVKCVGNDQLGGFDGFAAPAQRFDGRGNQRRGEALSEAGHFVERARGKLA